MHTASTPRAIDDLLARYGESHRNPVNELIHIICIPAIVFSLLGILWAIHPAVALLVVAGALAYYATLSRPFALGMGVMAGTMLVLLAMRRTAPCCRRRSACSWPPGSASSSVTISRAGSRHSSTICAFC